MPDLPLVIFLDEIRCRAPPQPPGLRLRVLIMDARPRERHKRRPHTLRCLSVFRNLNNRRSNQLALELPCRRLILLKLLSHFGERLPHRLRMLLVKHLLNPNQASPRAFHALEDPAAPDLDGETGRFAREVRETVFPLAGFVDEGEFADEVLDGTDGILAFEEALMAF